MTAADRMRRHRERRRRGAVVIRLEIDWDDMDALARRELLEENENDPAEIAKAVRAYLNETFGGI